MAIDTKVMINAIKHELNKNGRSSRLLPRKAADNLYAVFMKNGYTLTGTVGVITNNRTLATFMHTARNQVKVVFTTV